jgi:hypothetical protein
MLGVPQVQQSAMTLMLHSIWAIWATLIRNSMTLQPFFQCALAGWIAVSGCACCRDGRDLLALAALDAH